MPDGVGAAGQQPQRLLLVSANYRPSVGGVERFVEGLAEGIATRGWSVTVLCCRDGGAPLHEEQNGVRVVRIRSSDLLRRRWRVPYPLPSPVSLVPEVRRLVSSCDVVHVQDAIYATSVAALVAARARHVPSVLTQHVGLVPQSSRLLDAAEGLAMSTLGWSARLASRVVAYNDDVAAWAASKWHLQEVPILPIGIADPLRDSAPDRGSVRRALGLDEDRYLVLFVGRDVPKKRLDLALASTGDAYDVVALTDRPAGPAGGGVRVLPFLSPQRYRDLLLSVDAFVLPSEAEGIPLALQEALLAGLPCVLTRVPGYGRYLQDDDVLWVDPEPESIRTALASIASDPTLHAELASKARAAGLREFGLEQFLDAYEHLYLELARPT
jgi:glycosyltransferase involved in cell wall biosynthesis